VKTPNPKCRLYWCLIEFFSRICVRDRCGGDRDSCWRSQGRIRGGRNLTSGARAHSRGVRGRGCMRAAAEAALGSRYSSVRCTTPAKSNSTPPQPGRGVAGGVAGRAWAAVGAVAGRCAGRIRRRCGPPLGQQRRPAVAAGSALGLVCPRC
jgi:hypothetical protein